MRVRILLVMAVLLTAAVAGGSWWWLSRPAPLRHPTHAEVTALQSQADAACRCARRRGGNYWREDCWADFNRNVSQFERGGATAASFEESVTVVCFGPGVAGEPCIATQSEYNGCSSEESQRLAAEARARHQPSSDD